MPDTSVWIENTTSKYDHGGAGWEFSKCIWSPAYDRRGAESKYKIMRSVAPGDRVINCCDRRVVGRSIVATECITTSEIPPNPGPWDYATKFHRFELEQFEQFDSAVPLAELTQRFTEEIKADITDHRPTYYLFSLYPESEFHPRGKVVLSQGRFLARATPKLVSLIAQIMDVSENVILSGGHEVTDGGRTTV